MSSQERLFARLFSKAEMQRQYLAAEPSLHAYLHEVGRTPLLSAEQERQLLARIVQGDEQAKHRLIEANLRLVVTIALHYQNRGVPLLDLIQEGNLGLWQALTKFDPTRGSKFITYAKYWVLKRVGRAIVEQGNGILIPPHLAHHLDTLKRLTANGRNKGKEPTPETLAASLRLPLHQVKELLVLVQQDLISLDQPSEDGDSLTDLLQASPLILAKPDPEPSPLSAQVAQVISTQLSPRERLVIEKRFGLGTVTSATRKELAQQLGVTEERIRQMEGAALAKLRSAFEESTV